MSNIDKQALREAAEKATPGPWYVHDKPCEDGNYGVDTSDKEFLAEAVVWWGFARQSIWREEDAKFIASANPATVLALLDELEVSTDACNGWQRKFAEADERLEAAEKRIAELEARDKPKFVQCWSCKHDIEILAIVDCDGYCPRCAAPIDLDDDPYAAAGEGEAS